MSLTTLLEQLKRSITGLPDSSERKPVIYKQTSDLYKYRYKKTKDKADFYLAVQYSESLLRTVPLSHSVFGTYLFNHVHLLREYANTVRSLPQVERAVLTAGHYVANLRKDSIKQLDYRISLQRHPWSHIRFIAKTRRFFKGYGSHPAVWVQLEQRDRKVRR